MSRTVVIIVNYNSAGDTADCIRSIRSAESDITIIVVDNASPQAGIDQVEAAFPDVSVLRLQENVGFGRGNNYGIGWALAHTDCEFVLLLNADTIVEPGAISRLQAALDQHVDVGIAAPRIVFADAPEQLWYGGGEVDWSHGEARVPGYLGPADSDSALRPRMVDFASGCAMLIRRVVLEAVGGFDPRFFMYEEDLEISLRVSEGGWRIRYVPESLIHHRCQGSQRARGERFVGIRHPRNPRLSFYLYHITKNRLLTMKEHASGRNALRFWTSFPIYWSAKAVQYLLHGRPDAVKAMLMGARDFVRERSGVSDPRRTIQVERCS